MVIFVLSKEGFGELSGLIESGKYPVWLNAGIVESEEVDSLRENDVEVTTFSYVIDIASEESLMDALHTISEHHPSERIWCEYEPKI